MVSATVLGLGERVEEGAADSDNGTDRALECHLVSQNDAASNDNDDALEGVGHGVGHRGHLVEGHEGNLVVQVEGEAGGEGVEENVVLVSALLDVGVVLLDRLGALKEESDGQEHNPGSNVHNAVLVGGAHGLGPGLLHHTLANHGLEGSALVGNHARDDGKPAERQLLDGSKGNTADDGDQGQVHLPGLDIAQEHNLVGSRENGLAGLKDLGERHSAGTKTKNRAGMVASREHTNREKLDEVLEGHSRELAKASKPERDHPKDTNEELESGDEPNKSTLGTTKGIECPLIGNVVISIAPVPNAEENGKLQVLVPR
mmetsp:Transcript_80011/g.214141  ORF Transcript_80011/g.214141 Transcript_80011/m.214141 type:complete len:316 (+) Transcript_80011:67-1014(+)